ncbi:hypothetical protein JHT19_13330 [Vibrio parahaemolyticus]|nr:hypothetical protein JHT19_13330 [Vibrio parahaemolyticus]
MSNKNKGRVGETRVIRVITDIMDVEGNVDFTRHTNTNTADGGADIVLEHPEGFIDTLLEIADPRKLNRQTLITKIKTPHKTKNLQIA